MVEVQCKNCGLLAVRNQQTRSLDEVEQSLRERWQFPNDLRKQLVLPLTLIEMAPVCATDVSTDGPGNFSANDSADSDVSNSELPSEEAIEGGSLRDAVWLSRHVGIHVPNIEPLITGALTHKRCCGDFIQWIPSLSPRDHQLLKLDKQKEEKASVCQVSNATHSSDFTSISWFGTTYEFAKGQQSEAVRVLWKSWEMKTPTLSEKTIGEQIGSSSDNFQLSKVFRIKTKTGGYEPHPAWGTMIRRAKKGIYQLVEMKVTNQG